MKPKEKFALGTEQAFRVFLDAAPDAIVVVDDGGHIVMANKLAEVMFAYSKEDLLGQRVEMLLPEKSRTVHISHRTGYFRDPKVRPMGEGRELSGRRRDGTEFPIEISLSPLHTEQGILAISIIRDIAQRKQLEAKFRGLLESAPDGIVVVNTSGHIVIVNSQVEKLFGYARDELVGQPIEILVPSQFKDGHIKLRDGYIRHPKTRPMGAGRALTGRKKDGTEFPVEISLSPLETEQGTLVTSIVRDITDRRHAEEQLQASLREKEALLKEIHHRVKNNLQVTSSLLRLQSDYIQDPGAREMFAESQNRIRSMALVHEKLYRSSDLSRINFSEYVDSLAGLLFRSFGVNPSQIQFQLTQSSIFLSVETAVPCGLIINELLSNCFKHAFKKGQQGEIRVETSLEGEHKVKFTVSDNGVGLPSGFDFEKMDTLGLQLVRTLVKQLDGAIEIHGDKGAAFTVIFSKEREHDDARKQSN
ncbi:MAG: PAS domain S-box protein [Bacteriovoracia bacterium]